MMLRIKGLAASLLLSLPIAFGIYFIMSHIVELEGSVAPEIVGSMVLIVFSVLAIRNPKFFINVAVSFWVFLQLGDLFS